MDTNSFIVPKRSYFNWSSGKDSALALFHVLKNKLPVDRLLTTVNSKYQRVSMHGLRREVLDAQATAIGIALDVLEVPENPSMEDYNALMRSKIRSLKSEGFNRSIFGDIFLEDLKRYRDEMLIPIGFETVYPLWKRNTSELLREFLHFGFKAVIVCANTQRLDKSFLGRELSNDFLNALPDNVDPCGEYGEFHTFCYDGPIFKDPIKFVLGEKVYRTYDDPSDTTKQVQFGFCDVLLR